MAADRHWVEELFPPAFGIELEDIIQETQAEPKKTNVYELAATPISRFDLSTIRNVYERVWLMTALEEEEEERRKEREEACIKREAELRQRIPKDEPQPSKSQISKQETAEKLYLKGQDHLDEDSPEVDIHNVSLWSSNEIAVLRKVFSAARSENTRLQASLNIAQERIGKLDRLVKKRTSTLEEKVNVLSEATKANARLQMVTNSLKKDLDQAYVVNDGIEEDLKELRSENTDLRRELHEVRSDMESERIRRQNVEIDLSDQRSEAQRQIHLREESLALRHNSKVAALKKQLQEVREELQKERKDHDRTKRGLDHLRNHFSALPYKDHGQHQGMVTKDELQKWTY